MTDITVRKMTFEWPEDLGLLAVPGDTQMSCELAGISLTLPYLEPYLIRTMRAASKETDDPELVADLKAFSGQEAYHHRNHSRINEIFKSKLRPETAAAVEKIEAELSDDYQRYSAERPLKFNLAYGEGFEAMTLGLAVNLFEGGFERFDPDWAPLVEWHLAEEIEHRTVTFDAYDRIYGDYLYRVRIGTMAQKHFLEYVFRFAAAVWADVEGDDTPHPWQSWRQIIRDQWRAGLAQRVLRAAPPWYSPRKVVVPDTVDAVLAKYDAAAA